MVSRGDSTLRGHFPSDLVSLETGMGLDGEWIDSVSSTIDEMSAELKFKSRTQAARWWLFRCAGKGHVSLYCMGNVRLMLTGLLVQLYGSGPTV